MGADCIGNVLSLKTMRIQVRIPSTHVKIQAGRAVL